MSGKTIIITGGTAGIGLAAARALDQEGHRLILIGRDKTRGCAALASLSSRQGSAHRFISADLSLQHEVRAVVAEMEATETSIDVLANNAGTWFHHRELTSEGIERTVAVNHLAYVAMTLGLKRLLTASAGRVIFTGSFVYRHACFDPDNFQAEKRFSTNGTYASTKLYNLMVTRALARRWRDTGLTVTCFSPGFVATGFGKGEGGWLETYYRFIRLFGRAPERAATTLVDLAVSADTTALNGSYLEDRQPHRIRGAAADDGRCDKMLDWSARMTGFDPLHI